MTRIAVTGSRSYTSRAFVFATLDRMVPRDALLYVGDATGLDAFAREWAEGRRRDHAVCYADWDTWGKAAGPVRNQRMVFEVQELIAFIDGAGPGTKNCITQAKARGLIVHEVSQP